MTSHRDAFSESYGQARGKFLDAAGAAALAVQSHPHPLPGRDGETLAMDVVLDGAADGLDVLGRGFLTGLGDSAYLGESSGLLELLTFGSGALVGFNNVYAPQTFVVASFGLATPVPLPGAAVPPERTRQTGRWQVIGGGLVVHGQEGTTTLYLKQTGRVADIGGRRFLRR